MTATDLLDELRRHGVELAVEGDRLAHRAAAGVVTPARLAALAEHEDRLVALLRAEGAGRAAAAGGAPIAGDDGDTPRASGDGAEAEPPAPRVDDRPRGSTANEGVRADDDARSRPRRAAPQANATGLVPMPERATSCVWHWGRPLAPGHMRHCSECRATGRPTGAGPPPSRADVRASEDPRLDPTRCAHCGEPRAWNSLLYCAAHRDRQRERSRRAYEDSQRKRRR